jgi:DNA-binding IclR family transcriptional regulator
MAETSKTVTNAFRLLTCFTLEEPVSTVSLLTKRLRMSRTGVLRLAATLEGLGMLERNGRGNGYRIGIRAFELGSLYLASHPLKARVDSALDDLVRETGWTAYLGVLERDEMVTLTCREGTLPIRFIYRAGSRLPCTTTAIGKAILMRLESKTLDEHLGKRRELRRLTKNSLRTRTDLDKDLALSRRRGWSLACEEAHIGLTAVGAAILDGAGRPIAGISLSFLDQPPDSGRRKRFGTLVSDAANALSAVIADHHRYGERLAEILGGARMI